MARSGWVRLGQVRGEEGRGGERRREEWRKEEEEEEEEERAGERRPRIVGAPSGPQGIRASLGPQVVGAPSGPWCIRALGCQASGELGLFGALGDRGQLPGVQGASCQGVFK